MGRCSRPQAASALLGVWMGSSASSVSRVTASMGLDPLATRSLVELDPSASNFLMGEDPLGVGLSSLALMGHVPLLQAHDATT